MTLNPTKSAANSDNVISIGKARFTWLTDRFVRIEWARDGAFEDRPTFAVDNRHTPAVDWSHSERGGKHILASGRLRIVYTDDGRKLSKRNLKATFKLKNKPVTWRPGQRDKGNLGGTARTLDRVLGDRCTLGPGLISRDGWAVHDDSTAIVLDDIGDRRWPTPRPDGPRQDLYLLAYGHDFKAALRDAAQVFGRQPLPPRYVFGYWWSRFWAYTDNEFEGLVRDFDRHDVPLDVMVVDMDWHLPGWTGYTWDRRYFPDPDDFMAWLKSQDLKVTLNLHPADGVGRHEEAFEPMARDLGLDPKRTDRIPFAPTDPDFVDAYFKRLHHPIERQGCDFWWMDWQQGDEVDMPGLDPLPWLNVLHWRDSAAQHPERRPLIFSRFGGLGSGRHPIGFSGDTYSKWESLDFQPFFTATAANVLFGYWSHDIGGHQPGDIEPELYTRWIQYGVYSPILRTHTTRNELAERRVWEYPDPYSHEMIRAIRRRYELVPYIYTECRKAVDTGLSLCRPMYIEHPEAPEAYKASNQYIFGEATIAAPVTSPVKADSDLATVDVWLPKGRWIDTARGLTMKGAASHRAGYLISETPVFVKEGAIIPGQQVSRRLTPEALTRTIVTAWPGGDGRYDLYEDDGIGTGYLEGQSASIGLVQEADVKHRRTIRIEPARGGYEGFAPERSLEIRLPMTAPPRSVTVGGDDVPWVYRLEEAGWTWRDDLAGAVIRVPSIDVARGVTVTVEWPPRTSHKLADGLAGQLARLDRVRRYLTFVNSPIAEDRLAADLAQTGNRISRRPDTFAKEVRRIRRETNTLLKGLPAQMRRQKTDARKGYVRKARALLKDAK